MPDHDVLIVGAGPVGLLLACLLVQDGVRVAVYERRTHADDRTRAIGIHRPGLEALDAAGIGTAVRAHAIGGAEFALVMIRRLETGEVVILGEVPEDIPLLERAARKLVG